MQALNCLDVLQLHLHRKRRLREAGVVAMELAVDERCEFDIILIDRFALALDVRLGYIARALAWCAFGRVLTLQLQGLSRPDPASPRRGIGLSAIPTLINLAARAISDENCG